MYIYIYIDMHTVNLNCIYSYTSLEQKTTPHCIFSIFLQGASQGEYINIHKGTIQQFCMAPG